LKILVACAPVLLLLRFPGVRVRGPREDQANHVRVYRPRSPWTRHPRASDDPRGLAITVSLWWRRWESNPVWT